MTKNISQALASLSDKALRRAGLVALLLVTAFSMLVPERAQAQSSDTWKSIAIIGGSTAAGAIIGHEVGGRTGAYVGAAVGAGTGYAIDRRRRQNEYNNGYYGNNGYYDNNGGYYGNDRNYRNDGYYGGQGNSYPYGNGDQRNSDWRGGHRR